MELETFGLAWATKVFRVYMVGYTHACGCLKLTLLKESNSGKFAGHFSVRGVDMNLKVGGWNEF